MCCKCKIHTGFGRQYEKKEYFINNVYAGTSPVVQWLRLDAPSAEGIGSIPGQGTRSHMLQLRVHMLQLKIRSQTNQ